VSYIAGGAGLLSWGIKWQDAIIGLVALPALMVALGLAARHGAGGPIRFSGPLGSPLCGALWLSWPHHATARAQP
jgi:hypothetical protein